MAVAARQVDPARVAPEHAEAEAEAAVAEGGVAPLRGHDDEVAGPLREAERQPLGQVGLALLDPAWLNIEAPDATGFRGLTCSALVLAQL